MPLKSYIFLCLDLMPYLLSEINSIGGKNKDFVGAKNGCYFSVTDK